MKKQWSVLAVVGAAVLLGIAGCGGSSSTGSPDTSSSAPKALGGAVSKYQVAEALQPLTRAVVAYTDSDYGTDPADPATLALAEDNYRKVQSAEDSWRDFASGIDYAASDIAGLQEAIAEYNEALDNWQGLQDSGLATWRNCVAGGSNSGQVAMCLMEGYSADNEQAALTQYTTAVKRLLNVLGVEL